MVLDRTRLSREREKWRGSGLTTATTIVSRSPAVSLPALTVGIEYAILDSNNDKMATVYLTMPSATK